MANENVSAPAPIRSDDQILPYAAWLGYPGEIHIVSRMAVNNLYQPWRSILSMINQCLTCKTSGFDRPRYQVLQMMWGIITRTNIEYAELMWEEFVQSIQTFLVDKANLGSPTKKGKKTKPHVIPYSRFTKLIIYYLGRHHNIHQSFGSPPNHAEDDLSLRNLKFVPKGEIDEVFGMKIPEELITDNIRNAPYYNAYLEMVAKHERGITAAKEGGEKKTTPKADKPLVDEPDEEQDQPEAVPKPQGNVAIREPVAEATRPLPVVEGKGKAIATEKQDAQSLLALHTPKRRNAKTGTDTEKVISKGDTKILNIGEEQEEDVDNQVYLEEQTAKLDKGQARSDLVKLSRTFFNDKSIEDDPRKQNVDAEVVSMVTVPIHQASTSVPPLSTPIIDLSPPKPTTSPLLESFTAATTETTTTNLPLPPPPQQQSTTNSEELPEADMKEILYQRMFESGSYKSLPEHVALYEALESSMERENRDEFLAEKDMSPWKAFDTREAPSSSSKQQFAPHSEQPVEYADALAKSYKDPEENKLLRKTRDMRSYIKRFCKRIGKKKLSKSDLEGPAFKVVRAFHENNISLQFQMEECHQLLTDQVDLVNPEGHRLVPDASKPLPLGGPPARTVALSISKLKATNYPDFGLEELVPSLWIESKCDYNISAAYGITHWWFKRKDFYITRHNAPSDRRAVRSHMRILNVISIKTFERFCYAFLREIVIRRADYNEYKISKADFKNLHSNDFEQMYLLHFQGKLNHLPGSDKVHLYNAINLWIRNIVIKQHVGYLQLGIESYQIKVNLTEPRWDALEFLFKEDYTIISKPRALSSMLSRLSNVEFTSLMYMNVFVVQMSLPIIVKNTWTMATTIEQQVALDEALVPSTQRLRIGRSNFRLPSDVQSKESTLQVVYDVLRRCPFFKAFLVTADVPEIYMQEFWATTDVHHHSIRLKMDNKKHIVNLETFRDTLHICPMISGQSYDELPFEEEILDFLRFLGHSAQIRTLTDVNINKLFQPWRSFGAVINKCLTRKSFGFDSFRDQEHQGLQGILRLCHWRSSKPKASARRKRSGSDSSTTPPTAIASPRPTIAATPKLTAAAKGKQPAKATKAKSLSALSEVAMTKAEQPKLALKRSRQQMHISQPGGSGTDEGTSSKLGVLDVPSDDPDEEISWNSSDDEDADAQEKDRDDDKDDEKDESDDGEEDDDDDKDGDERGDDDEEEIVKIDEHDDTERGGDDDEESESDEESDDEETREDESFDPIPRTPEDSEDDGNDEEDQGFKDGEEEWLNEEEEADELYRDVDINQGRGLQLSQDIEDSHVNLTPVKPDGQQESSSVSSQFVTSMLNPTNDAGVESIFATASSSVAPIPTPTPTLTPSIIATITTASQAPIPPTPIPTSFSEYRQTNPFAEAVSNISGIVHQYMNQQMNEAVRVAVQIQTDRLHDSYQRENDEFLRTIDDNMKRIIKEQVKGQVKEQVLKILPRIKQSVNAQLEAEVLTRTSYVVAADLSEMELKKILIEKMEGNKSIQRSDEQRNLYKALVEAYKSDKIILDIYGETVTLKRRRDDESDKDEGPSAGSDRGSKRRREGKEPESASTPLQTATRSAGRSTIESKSRQASTSAKDQPIVQSSQHPECFSQPKKPLTLDHTPLDFSNFIMNRLRVDTFTPKLLAGPTYELMKGSCKSLTELEYHLEEVYKATTDQLDWVNPEGASSRKYTTSVTKTKVVDYGHIKWIEDLVPRTMWIQEPINYDKHALWGVSHWGRKRQQFYGFAVNQESALDVYSKRRIIAVMDLKIVEWHSYKHLDWITVRRDDDKLYKFKEGDFKRLHLQDIEDMLLLLVQGKLSNLTVEERFVFNVSLRMFTRSIVIQRSMKDLQLGVKSYQKRLNLTKPDTYRSDLK
uniref:Uncharacterized protein n=1 Tax=Tanacetum cinerariifolium TaxID=118510 RepID=A0A6L2KYL3_TANCI|nr:hypothetical protein [Tanacetum cinerariifolium]